MRLEDLGKLILRLAIGGLLILHGVAKLKGFPNDGAMAFIANALTAKGLPDALRFGVYVGEILAPLLIIVGFLTRLAGLIVAINMAMAIFLVQMDKVAGRNMGGGWNIEVEALFLLGGLAIFCLGAGRVSLRKGVPKVD